MPHGIENWKICVFCGKYFDIGTNFDTCPECRRRKLNKKERENGK